MYIQFFSLWQIDQYIVEQKSEVIQLYYILDFIIVWLVHH